ncbi:hypothetical protein MP228_003804 [Amoeboaphelidium protococcarum]|nr:hypothetical protein MP228_003804 [Amoeboaphelidium protococcarum]
MPQKRNNDIIPVIDLDSPPARSTRSKRALSSSSPSVQQEISNSSSLDHHKMTGVKRQRSLNQFFKQNKQSSASAQQQQQQQQLSQSLIVNASHQNSSARPSQSGSKVRKLNQKQQLEANKNGDNEDLCPVCGIDLFASGQSAKERESHINQCLLDSTGGAHQSVDLREAISAVNDPNYKVGGRYDVVVVPEIQVGKECKICFEDYEPDCMVSLLDCGCIYHRHCLSQWWIRKQFCPLHRLE